MNSINSHIILRALELSVHLGWPKEERQQEQVVVIDINIGFLKVPKGCVTDNLEDTYCYADLVNTLQEKLANKKFRLLEHLGYEIYQIIKQAIPTETNISIRVIKRPSIPVLTGGVLFYYGDEANTW